MTWALGVVVYVGVQPLHHNESKLSTIYLSKNNEILLCTCTSFVWWLITCYATDLPYCDDSCYRHPRQWRTEEGFNPLPPEIPKTLQNRAKLNPIVKTVKNCWI